MKPPGIPIRRTAPQRRTPLQPHAASADRRRRVRLMNAIKSGDAGPDAGLGDYLRAQPCRGCGRGPCDVAHILTRRRGHGTRDLHHQRPNVLSLCRWCHGRQDGQGFPGIGIPDPWPVAAAQRAGWEATRG